MNCHKVQNLASAFVDCELSGMEMLAIRQHLNECSACRQEFESLSNIKKAMGALQSKHPCDDLADRICQRLDDVYSPAHRHFLASLQKHLTVFPSRLRWAATGASLLSLLLVISAGKMSTNTSVPIPVSPAAHMVGLAEQNPVVLFPSNSTAPVSSDLDNSGPASNQPWELSYRPELIEVGSTGSHFVLAHD